MRPTRPVRAGSPQGQRSRPREPCGTIGSVQDAFGIVMFAVVGLATIVGLITFATSPALYKQIGRGPMSINEDDDGRPRPAGGGAPVSAAERDAEIRQMLAARNDRRARRGQPPLDVDAELARLTAPTVDLALRDEIRSLVVARNERRARAGKPPLDVEAEIARQIEALAQA